MFFKSVNFGEIHLLEFNSCSCLNTVSTKTVPSTTFAIGVCITLGFSHWDLWVSGFSADCIET